MTLPDIDHSLKATRSLQNYVKRDKYIWSEEDEILLLDQFGGEESDEEKNRFVGFINILVKRRTV